MMSPNLLDMNVEYLVEMLSSKNKPKNINMITDRLYEMEDELEPLCESLRVDCKKILSYVAEQLMLRTPLEVLELISLEGEEFLEELERLLK